MSQAFVCLSLLAYAGAAPAGPILVGAPLHHVAHHAPHHLAVGAGQHSHQSVSTAHGEVRTLSQSKAFGATHASVAQADNAEGLAEIEAAVHHAPVLHAVHPVAHHAVHHAPVVARSLSSRLNTQQLNENPSDVRQKDRLPKENKSKYNIEQHSFG